MSLGHGVWVPACAGTTPEDWFRSWPPTYFLWVAALALLGRHDNRFCKR
jgi:hypothetical protein